ncbi:MAG: hypothetical protein J5693_01470 [Bacteroidales bacterium]|nr:hypothetical protein [Bacteroidales bacterium]
MRVRAILLAALCALAAASCDNPYEKFSLEQEVTPEALQMGYSFDLPMDTCFTYNTAVVCRLDTDAAIKETVDLTFDVISPTHESFKERISFPVITNVRQKNALGGDANIIFKKRGSNLDNQWGWRRGITCDSIPGRWLVRISVDNPVDRERIRAIGFTYKGYRK